MFRTLKNFISKLIALSLALVVSFAVYIGRVCRLDGLEGERVFYLDSASSQGLRKEELSLRDFARIKGESVRFERGEEREEDLVQSIVERYGAEILFQERTAETLSYYCYTKEWDNGIIVNGERVNLHIALSETQCVVGTPIIFDGF